MEQQYISLLSEILTDGWFSPNRTGVGAQVIHDRMIKFDLSKGFPLLTTKFVSLKMVAIELEFFLKGITSKKWLQERGCHIWDEWCAPELLVGKTFASSAEKNVFMREQDYLGPIYGAQWTNWGGINQIAQCIEKLKNNPTDRGNLVSAWNVSELPKMALRPCHYGFQVNVRPTGELDLSWNQRSVDTCLGLPYNIASYALLTHLLAKECGLTPGTLTGFLGNVHVYENHIEQAKMQITRKPLPPPQLTFKVWRGFNEWDHDDIQLVDYKHCGKINYEMTAI